MNRNRKNVVRLTESKLRNIIKESVKSSLRESDFDHLVKMNSHSILYALYIQGYLNELFINELEKIYHIIAAEGKKKQVDSIIHKIREGFNETKYHWVDSEISKKKIKEGYFGFEKNAKTQEYEYKSNALESTLEPLIDYINKYQEVFLLLDKSEDPRSKRLLEKVINECKQTLIKLHEKE